MCWRLIAQLHCSCCSTGSMKLSMAILLERCGFTYLWIGLNVERILSRNGILCIRLSHWPITSPLQLGARRYASERHMLGLLVNGCIHGGRTWMCEILIGHASFWKMTRCLLVTHGNGRCAHYKHMPTKQKLRHLLGIGRRWLPHTPAQSQPICRQLDPTRPPFSTSSCRHGALSH